MYLSQGEKMCHYCFLKFLTLIEQNDFLDYLFGEVWKKNKEEQEKRRKELQKYIPNLLPKDSQNENNDE